MKLITRDTDYAIRALCCMAKNKDKKATVLELSKCLKMPRPFLRKILQRLGKKSIVHSYRGKGGGFSLAASPDSISLLDVILALQGPVMLNDHTFMKRECPEIKKCTLKKRLDKLEKIMLSGLKVITIDSII